MKLVKSGKERTQAMFFWEKKEKKQRAR